MTEPMIAAPDDTSAGESGAAPWQERKALLAVAGVGGAAVLGLGAWFLLFSGGGAAEEEGLVPSARKPAAVVAPAAEAAKPAVTTLATVPADDNGRDPFDPLYVAVAPALPSEAPAPPVDPTVPLGSGGVPITPPDTSGQQSSSKVKVRLVNLDLGGFRAQVSVNGGSAFWVNEGKSFGPRNSLTLGGVYAEDGGYATFYVGDDEEGTATDIYVGDSKKF
jgi:hypothetical protein